LAFNYNPLANTSGVDCEPLIWMSWYWSSKFQY
jgi:hypothetical protein